MNKPCTVVISGRPAGENLQDIEVPSGATAGDVLQAVGLDRNWTLSREGSNQTFAFEETIYDSIEEGCKLRATPVATVGAIDGFWEWLEMSAVICALGVMGWAGITLAIRGRRAAHAQRMEAMGRRWMPSSTAGHSNGAKVVLRNSQEPVGPANGRIQVQRDRRSLCELRGWRRQGNKLVGAYRLGRHGAFAGEIHLSNLYRPRFFIVNPPQRVLSGPHGACFRRRDGYRHPTYEVHFGIHNASPDAGVAAVEHLLLQSI